MTNIGSVLWLICGFLLATVLLGLPANTLNAAAKATLPCGTYQTANTIFNKIKFEDEGRVTLDVSGQLFKTFFKLHNNLITIKSDHDYLVLEIRGNILIGHDIWTKESRYRRTGPPDSTCNNPPIVRTHGQALCFSKTSQLNKNSSTRTALLRYEDCCKKGDGASCNALGALSKRTQKRLGYIEKDFGRACALGNGFGCANLAAIALKKGNKGDARRLSEKACHYEHADSCISLLLSKQFSHR